MLTVSVLWVVLAAVVTVAATTKRSSGAREHEKQSREAGRGLAVVAVLYSLALLAGFVYVSKFFVSGL